MSGVWVAWKGKGEWGSQCLGRKDPMFTSKTLEEFLALKMTWEERRYDPLSLWAHSHVCGSGRRTDKGDGWDLMMILLQDLAVEMNGEQFWPRAHSNQMPANVVMGTNSDIWEGEMGSETGSQHFVIKKKKITHELCTEHLLCIRHCFKGYRHSSCGSCPSKADIWVTGKQVVTT